MTGDYIFFAAYLAKDSEKDAADVNGAMLRNFLEALEISGIGKEVKRIILVTGAKQYGVHLGPVKNPMEESDPWLEGGEWPPNFYYVQQRVLKEAGEKSRKSGGGWDWTVTYPNDVLGVAKGNFSKFCGGVEQLPPLEHGLSLTLREDDDRNTDIAQ